MNRSDFDAFSAFANAIRLLVVRSYVRVTELPLPVALVACLFVSILVSLLVAILPLALLLFAFVLIAKLARGLFASKTPAGLLPRSERP